MDGFNGTVVFIQDDVRYTDTCTLVLVPLIAVSSHLLLASIFVSQFLGCSDDARQISRWLKSAGPKGRFRSQLCNKIIAAGTTCGDVKISPVIRQTLLHWGLDVTEAVLEKHRDK
jgi:hypothetical protein